MNYIKDQIHCERAYRMGLSGKGIGVAVLDTGIFLHRDFDSRVTGFADMVNGKTFAYDCLLYTSPSPRDGLLSRMPSSA